MLTILDWILNKLYKIELFLATTITLGIIIINSLNLLSRWFFKNPFSWILEISLILFVYSVLLCVPALYKKNGFIKMNLIESFIGKKGEKILNIIIEIIILLFLVYLLYFSFFLSIEQLDLLSRGLGIPRFYITIPVVISSFLTIPISISRVLHILRDF